MVFQSVYEEAKKEAAAYKWIKSEQACHDLGDDALHEWSCSYWLGFYRYRFVQHLRGEIFWREFDEKTFGVLPRRFAHLRELLHEILDQIRKGQENLNLIVWAHDTAQPMNQVIAVLEALDINSQRLPPPDFVKTAS